MSLLKNPLPQKPIVTKESFPFLLEALTRFFEQDEYLSETHDAPSLARKHLRAFSTCEQFDALIGAHEVKRIKLYRTQNGALAAGYDNHSESERGVDASVIMYYEGNEKVSARLELSSTKDISFSFSSRLNPVPPHLESLVACLQKNIKYLSLLENSFHADFTKFTPSFVQKFSEDFPFVANIIQNALWAEQVSQSWNEKMDKSPSTPKKM